MLKNFHRNNPVPPRTTLTLIVRMCLIFVATIDYKNIFTMKISRFTAYTIHTCIVFLPSTYLQQGGPPWLTLINITTRKGGA